MTLARLSISLMLIFSLLANRGMPSPGNDKNYVKKVCRVTRYRDICVRSLAPFASTGEHSPSKWASAGVSVALGEAKGISFNLRKVKQHRPMKGRNNIALLDCIECFQDAIDNLHKSLGILRELNGKMFGAELGDLMTWMSTALTDEDTCLDGFSGQNKQILRMVRRRVLTVSHMTSNALALVSRLGVSPSVG